jgi:hypothetical protein
MNLEPCAMSLAIRSRPIRKVEPICGEYSWWRRHEPDGFF